MDVVRLQGILASSVLAGVPQSARRSYCLHNSTIYWFSSCRRLHSSYVADGAATVMVVCQ